MRKIYITITILIMLTILIACSPPFDSDVYEIVFNEENPYLTAHFKGVNLKDTSKNEFIVKVYNKETGKYQLGRIINDSKYMTVYDLPEGVEDFEFIGFDDVQALSLSIQTNLGIYFITYSMSVTNFHHFEDFEFQYDKFKHYLHNRFVSREDSEQPYFTYDGKINRAPWLGEVIEGEKHQYFEIDIIDDEVVLNVEISNDNGVAVLNKQFTLLEENTYLKAFYLVEFLPTVVLIRENELVTINLNYDYEIESTNTIEFTKEINRYGRFMQDMFYILTDDTLYVYDKKLEVIAEIEITENIYGINSFPRNGEASSIIYVLKKVDNLLVVEEIYKYESI